jgi:hypothetical protein
MPLPQEIRPLHQDLQDTIYKASDALWIERPNGNAVRYMWTGSETGTWVAIFRWKKGFVAGPHKHLSASHTYIIKGKLKVRDGILETGDYDYEPNGVLHDRTEALEDTEYLFICNGPLLGFNDDGFTGYTSWEEVEKAKARAQAAADAKHAPPAAAE